VKSLYGLLVVGLMVAGCSDKPTSKKAESLKVGMTYDDVQSLMGNPAEIKKGWTTLAFSVSRRDSGKVSVNNGGQLIETAWQYNEFKYDTTCYFEKRDTTFQQARTEARIEARYLLNGNIAIDYDSYVELKAVEVGWWIELEKIPGESKYHMSTAIPQNLVDSHPGAVQVKTLSVARGEVTHSLPNDIVTSSLPPKRVYQVTESKFTIVFDSASGRLKSWGFQPILVQEVRSK